jgi:hypothetical protein
MEDPFCKTYQWQDRYHADQYVCLQRWHVFIKCTSYKGEFSRNIKVIKVN